MACGSLLDWAADPYIGRMDTNQIMNLAFLGLLGAAIAGSYIVANRDNLSKMGQQAAIWALIFVGVIAAVGLWGDIARDMGPRAAVVSGGTVTVPQSVDGHFYMTLDVNGTPVNFVVDTGATQIVLSQDDAARIGLDPANLRYLSSANTANGVVQTAGVRLSEIAIGPIIDRDVRAVVNGGQMDGSLLGMDYLNRFDSVSFSNGELTLSR